ncbi:prevent-host-death protein [Austwickia chelonae]|uniref:prevent-host-death protein n=1 Tax=Austwickia chelonae TaxID=100225 RepID=UPI000E24CA42|nr:prevent-host-death protein [Austwickia chelonae]
MPSVEFATVTEARAGFKAMFEAAQNGGAGLVHRDGHRFALVDADRIADALHAALPITPEVYFEEDVVGLALPGAPFAAEGNDLEEAAEEMIEALREYAQDWEELRHAPNHAHLSLLVLFVVISTNEKLKAWLTGEQA